MPKKHADVPVGTVSSLELEDLEGIGDAIIEKLKTVGIHTVEALAFTTEKELEQVGILKVAPKIIGQAKDSILKQSYIHADELMRQRLNVRKLTTGSKSLDAKFKGGYETQNITEVAAEFGGGKTQLAFTAAVCVQQPEESGGLNGGVLFVDSEETFKPERVVEIATARGLDADKILKGIVYAPAYNSDHQMLILQKADEQIKQNNIKLIVVDSVMAHFRNEYLGREELATRQGKLNQHLHQILRLARAFNAVAFITNQVTANPSGNPYAPQWFAAGGNIMGHISGLRLQIRKAGANKRIATITDSSWLPYGEAPFILNEKGIDELDVEKK